MFILQKAMAPHSSTLAWKIPWMEEPGRLQSMGSRRVGHDWVTSLSLSTFMHWRRKWQPTPVFLPGESQGRGSLVAAVYGVAQSRAWLKRLSSSSSSNDYLSSWALSNPERGCCESAALNMPANLENSAVATVPEKVSFHSNPKERQCQRMLKLPHNCTHLTR